MLHAKTSRCYVIPEFRKSYPTLADHLVRFHALLDMRYKSWNDHLDHLPLIVREHSRIVQIFIAFHANNSTHNQQTGLFACYAQQLKHKCTGSL
jgi:hypothetical protein